MILRTVLSVALIAVTATAQKVGYDEFTTMLSQAQRLNDAKTLDRAVKENSVHTLSHYRGLVLGMLSGKAQPDNEEQRRLLREAWTRSFSGRTLERLDRWLQEVGETALRNDEKAQQALNQAYAEMDRLSRNKVSDRRPYEALRDSLLEISRAFETIGNALGAADAWGVIGTVYVAIPSPTLDDKREAISAIARFLEHRDSWDWKTDDFYLKNANWLKAERERLKADEASAEKRRAEGYGDNVRGTAAYLVPDADASEIKVPVKFDVWTKPKADMCVQGGPIPMMWPRIDVSETGPTAFQWFKGAGLFLVRPGATKYGVTLDGSEVDLKKNKFTPVTAGNKPKKPNEFFLDAEETRPYAMWMFTGGSQEAFQGYNQNLEPQPERATVYYKSAGSWSAEIDGVDVVIFDDNNNGKIFEEDPFEYGLSNRHIGAGPGDEVRIPAYDGMKIGKEPERPYSSWVEIGQTWYHLRGHDGGTSLGVRKTNPEYFKTGTIQLEWAGPKAAAPEVVIVEGEGDFATARFNLADGDPVEVPAGRYRLTYGRVVSGKPPRALTCDIFGGAFEPVAVEEGKNAVVALGEPFHVDFDREGSGDKVKINALKMRVRGRGGELYVHINGAAPAPEVVTAKSEDGKGAKVLGEFVNLTDPEMAGRLANANSTLGSHVGFYPVVKGDAEGSLELEVSVPRGQLLGLRQNKNKLFGKLEPVWK